MAGGYFDIFQKDDGLTLGQFPCHAEGGVADNLFRCGRINELMIEQSQAKFFAQDPAYGLVDSGLGHLSAPDQFNDHLRTGLATELINTRLQRFFDSLSQAQMFHAPGPGAAM